MNDQFNNDLVLTASDVDAINKEFYGKYNYPWPPLMFQAHLDHGLYDLVNQELGYYKDCRLPRKSKIWVAGCGTNQAIFTALKFPESEIQATDISTESLAVSKRSAMDLGLTNITFNELSILDSNFSEQFDYVICTGVIHHTANPLLALQRLQLALKKSGILELMVYNYYHRITTTAFQKAIKILSTSAIDFAYELNLSKKLVNSYDQSNLMGDFLAAYRHSNDAELADSLIQPVEFSYTVTSLYNLMQKTNLEFLVPCFNQFDQARNAYNWNLKFNEPDLKALYDNLTDRQRWQVSNLLLLNESPMLWFYLQKGDSEIARKTESEICNAFLNTRFQKFNALIQNFKRTDSNRYVEDGGPKMFPTNTQPPDSKARLVYQNVSDDRPMIAILKDLNIDTDFDTVNLLRLNLTTPLNPYLIAKK